MADAPVGPVSGLLTSQATSSSQSGMRASKRLISMLCRLARAAPPWGRSAPALSSSRTPRACAMPAPASLVALPPMPMMNRRKPASSADAIASPSPYVVVTSGLRSEWGSRARPDVRAISMTAVRRSPIAPHSAGRCSPRGPVTAIGRMSPPEPSTKVSSVPSPPSATGTRAMSASGAARDTPSRMARAASRAEMLPLNVWGAITIFIMLHYTLLGWGNAASRNFGCAVMPM